ncbi:MAG: hypothetical protein ACOCRK_07990 [bacterium]
MAIAKKDKTKKEALKLAKEKMDEIDYGEVNIKLRHGKAYLVEGKKQHKLN